MTEVSAQKEHYRCEVIKANWWLGQIPTRNICSLRHVQIPSFRKDVRVLPHWEVTSIKGLRFLHSKMEVLTSDFCETLPFLVCFDTRRLGLVSVDSDVFEMCAELEQVDLSLNNINAVPTIIFDRNEKLKAVFLNNNRLIKIDVDLFKNNGNLVYLNLNNNRLRSLPQNLFDYNPKLTYLRVANNELGNVAFLFQIPVVTHLSFVHLERNKLWRPNHDAIKLRKKFPNLHEIRT